MYDWTGRTGDVWADEWRRTDRSFAGVSRHLDAAILTAAPAEPFRALDIGCGAGATSLALAAACARADVTGVDLSASLIAVARDRGAVQANARFAQGDVLAAASAIRPDLLVSRHGMMFFDDPSAAFARLAEAAPAGARLVFSCFGPREANRFATIADEAVGAAPPTPSTAPGPFAFADHDHVWSVLSRAGWRPDAAARIEFAYRVGAGPDPIGDAVGFLSRIGPAAAAIASAPAADRARIQAALARLLTPYHIDDGVDLPATAWIWRAQKGKSA